MSNASIRQQPTIGILGGSSHVITTRYYDLLNTELRRVLGGQHIAETLIRGMNFGNVRQYALDGDWAGLKRYVGKCIDDLERGGADLIIGCSNTVHEVMGEVMAGRGTAFLPISAPLIDAIRSSVHERIAMFGTKSTMQNGAVMQEVKAATGIDLIAPREAEQDAIARVIFGELCESQFLPSSRDRYVAIARRMAEEDGVEAVILGCTEIMLLIGERDLPELTVFATGQLHIEAAARWASERVSA